MGYDLVSKHGTFSTKEDCYSNFIKLGQLFGWEPMGTESYEKDSTGEYEKDKDWCGSYMGNDWQRVNEEDADRWGEALDKAIRFMNNQSLSDFPEELRKQVSDSDIYRKVLSIRDSLGIVYIMKFRDHLRGGFTVG